MENDPVDRISNLPEFILHNILSSLPRGDAARTCVLSTRWNRAWESFPVLDFSHIYYLRKFIYRPRSDPESIEAGSNFLSMAKKWLARFYDSELRVERFLLITTFSHPKLPSIVKECLDLALKCKASEIKLLLGTTDKPDLLEETSSFSGPIIKKYYFLERLSISGIRASEKTIKDIIRNCPNIRSLSLGRLEGLTSLDISELDGLESLAITSTQLLTVDIDAPSLRAFFLTSSCKDTPNCTVINLKPCLGLRDLRLDDLAITDESFHSLVSGLPLLENLTVSCCEMLRRVVISGQHLKSLYFSGCNEVDSLEIGAPSLSSFRYTAAETLSRLSLSNIPSLFEIYYRLYRIPINNSHFVNLRQFLATSTVGEVLNVAVDTWEVIFDPEELVQEVIPPAFQLQHLKLEFTTKDWKFVKQTLVDGLLWSCRPRAISVSSGTIFENSFIKILCKNLMETEKYPMCCGSSHIKCWRHDFKSARIESFGANWSVLLENLACDGSEGPVICFKLEWYDSI